LKNRSFSGSCRGTDSALRVGFGGGFGVKVAVLWGWESTRRLTFGGSKRLKSLKKLNREGFRSY
jgi:hypothetical protein